MPEDLNKNFVRISDIEKFNACIVEVLNRAHQKVCWGSQGTIYDKKTEKSYNGKIKSKENVFKISNE